MAKASGPKTGGKSPIVPLRPRFLSEEDVARIVEIVRYWPRLPMTWEGIREDVSRRLLVKGPGRSPRQVPAAWSRQALSKNPLVKKAYDDRRQELAVQRAKGPRSRVGAGAPETVVLRQQVEVLQIEIKTLQDLIAAYEDRFRTMLVNRALGKNTEEGMSEPLSDKTERRRVVK